MKKTFSKWYILHISVMLLTAAISPIFYQQMSQEFDNESFSWYFILELLILVVVSIFIILSIQYKNPFSKRKWHKPSWDGNPFDLHQPLQYFYTTGWIFIVLGTSVAIYTLLIGSLNLLFLFPLTIGIGVIVGVKLSLLAYRTKFNNG